VKTIGRRSGCGFGAGTQRLQDGRHGISSGAVRFGAMVEKRPSIHR
jgi:hypothetical protein